MESKDRKKEQNTDSKKEGVEKTKNKSESTEEK
jgi:hypothetical protein